MLQAAASPSNGRCSVSTSRASGTSAHPVRATPMSTRNRPSPSRSAARSPAHRPDHLKRPPRLLEQQLRHAPRRIPTSPGFRTIRITYPHHQVRIRPRRRPDAA